MATDSGSGSADEKARNSVSQAIPHSVDDSRDMKLEPMKEASPASVFVNSEPIREEQVQNAVKFLAHPKVMGSPVMYRRSFLEKKGLTKEEIDEAFRRVPDPSPAVTTTGPVDGQIRSSSNIQSQAPSQVLQPASGGTIASSTKMGILSRFKWYHTIIALGLLATSGIGTVVLVKNSFIPWLKSWVRKVVVEELEGKESSALPSLSEETAAAAKSAAAAAADVARASQEIMVSRSEEKRCFEELIRMLNVQVIEMKSMNNSLKKLESGQSRTYLEVQDKQSVSKPSFTPPYSNGGLNGDSHSERPLSPPTAVASSVANHPSSYMEIIEMVKRGEKPSNIRDINDAPPNPNQPVSNPRLAPRPKPWEAANQATNVFSNAFPVQGSGSSSFELADNHLNVDSSVPYWQQKNVRITEIEEDREQPVSINPARRSWVPPQPPPVMMPEAAAAIRQPKKSVDQTQTELLSDEQLLSGSTSVNDELQRITQVSESGGVAEPDQLN